MRCPRVNFRSAELEDPETDLNAPAMATPRSAARQLLIRNFLTVWPRRQYLMGLFDSIRQ